jgi:hypothetical protein
MLKLVNKKTIAQRLFVETIGISFALFSRHAGTALRALADVHLFDLLQSSLSMGS